MDGMDESRPRSGVSDVPAFLQDASERGVKVVLGEGYRLMKTDVIEAARHHCQVLLIHLRTERAYSQYQSRCAKHSKKPITTKCYKMLAGMANSFGKKHSYVQLSYPEAEERVREILKFAEEKHEKDKSESKRQNPEIQVKMELTDEEEPRREIFVCQQPNDIDQKGSGSTFVCHQTSDIDQTGSAMDSGLGLVDRSKKRAAEMAAAAEKVAAEAAVEKAVADMAAAESAAADKAAADEAFAETAK